MAAAKEAVCLSRGVAHIDNCVILTFILVSETWRPVSLLLVLGVATVV